MHPVAHARLTTAAVVAVGGMAAGHLLAPHAPGASPARGVAFYALMLLAGAWRGRREGRAADAPPRAYRARAALYAAAAPLLAALANALVHGA